jgi:hypothetical protein
MAIVTKQLAFIDGGAFVLEFDYDNVDLRIRTIRGINTGVRSYAVTATSTSNGRQYTATVNAGVTVEQNVPTGAAQRLQLLVTPSGKLDGVEWSIV